jgi:hypothetical protein
MYVVTRSLFSSCECLGRFEANGVDETVRYLEHSAMDAFDLMSEQGYQGRSPWLVSRRKNGLQLRSESAAEQCNLGDLLFASKQFDRSGSAAANVTGAWANFTALRDAPRMRLRNWSGVVPVFSGSNPKTHLSLPLANQAAGKHDAAVSALEKGRRLFPASALLQKLTSTKNWLSNC